MKRPQALRRQQSGWIHAVALALLLAGAVAYFGIPYLLASNCERPVPAAPLSVVIRSGDTYCLWQVGPGGEFSPTPDRPGLGPASVQRCSNDSYLVQQEADIFNGNRIPSGGPSVSFDCPRTSFLNLVPDAYRYWQTLWRKR